ncbi:MAG: tRNA 4-thiouridine(8) synthase ThiI [Oscillospiraceae bacterium]|jgi:thiamine biosynthesis protein ThiI|nr:tRNA 4-thiouridine(8) synthase ThiI [Oscillospiraceae bacterium]
MNEVLLIKAGELVLKGLNRRTFEDQLLKNLRRALRPLGPWQYHWSQSTLQAIPGAPSVNMAAAAEKTGKVFGIAGYSRALRLPKDMTTLLAAAPSYLSDALRFARTFKCEAKRSDKRFPLRSPQICEEMGEVLCNAFPHLRVDVRQPDVTIHIEIRDQYAFLHAGQLRGAGGLPVGTAGEAVLLISGGIDSPVAAWMMARRGLRLTAVHFASPPYTSPRAEEKVHKLLAAVAGYAGRVRLFVVPFTAFQEQIRERCPEDLFTLVMRRAMMRIAEQIALRENCGALITGESLGQVASQTLQALACTNSALTLPVFRPLVGMDKNETIEIARKIETFEISVLPYEDCCTVFTPRHPRTKPKLSMLTQAEQSLDWDILLADALKGAQFLSIEAEGVQPCKRES